MKQRHAPWTVQIVTVLLLHTSVLVGAAAPAQAADPGGFDPGMIIADEVFFAPGTMTVGEIQAFLDEEGSRCAPSESGVPCLKDYRVTTPDRPASAQCRAYVGAEDETAAQIIWKTAQACGVNPQALIVILQREQALVTASGPALTLERYRSAMGYACPTGGACAPAYAGFANQLYSAAARFQYYARYPERFTFRAGRDNVIPFHPDAACGSASVYIRNQATAGLYNYTPYQPNAASLEAGIGTGDECSSYGNRNFSTRFRDWFGPTEGEAYNPFGQFDSLVGEPGGLRIRGWAIDPDTIEPIFLWVTVDGVGRHVYANAERGDVGRAFPAYGDDQGFSARIRAGEGAHRVCVTAANVGIGRHVTLGCRTAVVPGGSPFGNFEEAGRAADGIKISGWAIDPDTSDPVFLWVTVDGKGRHVYADAERGDVARHFPAYGLDHGFAAVVPASAEPHRVCVTISNVGSGRHTELGCRNISGAVVPDTSPVGNFEEASGGQGVIDVRGWAVDADTASPIYVWLTVDGVGRHLYANVERADIARAFPEAGAAHGFEASVPAAPGTRRVCASAANVGPGKHKPLSCRVVTVGSAVEEVAAVITPTPAPSPSPSASPTPTPSPSASPSPTPTPSASPTPTPTPTARPGGRPDAGNTGVPAGTSLAVHNGDMVITTHGAVVDGMDIRGTVSVRANNVVIKNSRIRGRTATYNTPLISMNKGNTNLRVLDTEIAPDNPSPYLYGIMGWEFTLERVNIHHVVDSAHIYGPNATIRASWLHDNVHYENDPNFGGTPTHDDGVQIQQGSNIRLIGNRIEGAYNAAVQITQDQGVTRDVQITGNWLDGGGCTVNIAEKSYGPIQALISADNRFGRGTRHYDCAMIAPRTTPIVARDNYFTDGLYARVRNGG